jgi:hypothetical protein
MHARWSCALPLAAASLGLAAFAQAGVVSGEVQRMEAGAGFLDLDFPMPDPFFDLASIVTPPVGSFILVEESIPDIRAYRSRLGFMSIDGVDANFDFENSMTLSPWHLGDYEFAFAANRLAFTSDLGVIVTLTGDLATSGTGYGFFEVGGDLAGLVTFGESMVSYSVALGPGAQVISWGSLVGNAGGFADFEGTVTLTLVPGPGSFALFVAAGAVARRRRRSD